MAHRQKTGGREKGTPNRTTTEMRELLHEVFDTYASGQLHLDMKATDPETRLRFMLEVAKLITPKPPTILGFDRTEQPIFTGIDLDVSDTESPNHIHITRRAVGGTALAEQPLFPPPFVIEIPEAKPRE